MAPTGFRYRTAALVGPWRPCPDEAVADALRAHQARLDDRGRVSWLVTGAIEAGETIRALPRRSD